MFDGSGHRNATRQGPKAPHSETIGKTIQYAVSFAIFQPGGSRAAMVEARTTTGQYTVIPAAAPSTARAHLGDGFCRLLRAHAHAKLVVERRNGFRVDEIEHQDPARTLYGPKSSPVFSDMLIGSPNS
jgi:hypothetical protein